MVWGQGPQAFVEQGGMLGRGSTSSHQLRERENEGIRGGWLAVHQYNMPECRQFGAHLQQFLQLPWRIDTGQCHLSIVQDVGHLLRE